MTPTRNASIGPAVTKGAEIVLAGLALVLGGCSSTSPVGPSNQPQIGNNPDNFQFQATNLSQTTQTLTYSWTNTGSVGTVNQSGQIPAVTRR
jgi:outer membrane biogenesis lipoprotein LolB